MTGFTAISQCNEFEGSSGQVAVTAITRRHGYMRGHGNRGGGYQTNRMGNKVWFCAADNTVIPATVYSIFVQCFSGCGTNYNEGDYGLVLFDQDLDSRIQPVSVMTAPAHLVVVFSPCQEGKMGGQRAAVPFQLA